MFSVWFIATSLCVFCPLVNPKSTPVLSASSTPTSVDLARTVVNVSVPQGEDDLHIGNNKFWEELEKSLRSTVNSATKEVLRQVLTASSDVKISPQCMSSLMKTIAGVKSLKIWAFRMLDASGKIASGILDGTLTEIGSFDECLNIKVKNRKGYLDFRGKYCTVNISPRLPPRPPDLNIALMRHLDPDNTVVEELKYSARAFYHMSLRQGVCVPSTCTNEDVKAMAKELLKSTRMQVEVPRCHVKEDIDVEPVHIAVLFALGLITLLVAVGTAVDIRYQRALSAGLANKPGILHMMLTAFSIRNNTKKVMSTDSSVGDLAPLHGVRLLSLTWIMVGHTYSWRPFNSSRRTSNLQLWLNHVEFEVIHNGWIGVVSFVFLSGLLSSYSVLNVLKVTKGRLNIPVFIFRRYLRLVVPLLMTMGIVFFLPWIATGPFWYEVAGVEVDNCYRSWWKNLLFISNWYPIQSICVHISWYVSCDLQMYAISLVLILILYRKPTLGLFLIVATILASLSSVAVVTYLRNYPGSVVISAVEKTYIEGIVSAVHIKPYTQLGPYCVGMLVGYALLNHRSMKIPSSLQAAAWCVAIVSGVGSLYGLNVWTRGIQQPLTLTLMYASLHRTCWAVSLGWLVFACLSGHAGPINAILSYKPLMPFSRLAYFSYLLQGPVLWTRYGSLRERMFYGHQDMIFTHLATMVIVMTVAFVCHLLVEAPFAALERLAFSKTFKSQTRDKNLDAKLQSQCRDQLTETKGKKTKQITGEPVLLKAVTSVSTPATPDGVQMQRPKTTLKAQLTC